MNQSRIKAVISDLDGTLLNSEHTLSEYSKSVVKALSDQGIHFMIATGRHHMDASKIREKLGVEAYLITANGATVANKKGELIFQAAIRPEVVKDILDITVEKGVYKNLYQGDHWLMEESDKIFDDYYQEGDFQYTLCRFDERIEHPTNKIFFTALDHKKLTSVAALIEKTHGDEVEVTFSMPECLEIMPKGVNKGAAILETIKHFDISADEVIAFGDGLNDLEMLQVVGKGYLMGNANILLKEKLPNHEIIGKNADDAVARQIVKLFGLEEKVPYKAAI
ncbi:Cof-type HAD-IIB family hydrolase [Fusibacter bizertensis]